MAGTVFNTKEKQIGDTLYIIESAYSDNATETVYSKLKRLIQNSGKQPLKEPCILYGK